jgi:hypothetical protein
MKFDAERDLRELGLAPDIPVYPKESGQLPKGPLSAKYPEGVMFCTYSLLVMGSGKVEVEKKKINFKNPGGGGAEGKAEKAAAAGRAAASAAAQCITPGRGLHSSIIRLNLITSVWIRLVA